MKQILFNTDMVRAILEGRKTVTRRVVKPQPEITPIPTFGGSYRVSMEKNLFIKPPYRPNDILYVRETWCPFDSAHVINGVKYAYKADSTPESERVRKDFGYKWRPSIHMPREAARIFLRVTDVRVEPLRDITKEDLVRDFCLCREAIETVGRDALAGPFWDATIKPVDRELYGWGANPWVRVIEFERCERPKGD